MSHKIRVLKGSASNLIRVLLSALVALILPPLLVRRLEPAEYGAWILILQCGAYITLLDFGLQTAIGRFIAKNDTLGDYDANGKILSSSVAILCISAVLGMLTIAIVCWQVPEIFHQTPAGLVGGLREGILLVGLSTAVALPFNAFLAVFVGLQRYGFPTALAMASKLSTSAALIAVLLLHGGVVPLAWTMAAFTVATAFVQFLGWAKYEKGQVTLSLTLIERNTAIQLAKYGSVLSIWTVATLLISGMDLIIIGHYDFKSTAYYGIASTATNFMLLLISSAFSPLVPAISSLQTARTPADMGRIAIKLTRYCSLSLCGLGLPLLIASYPLLNLWVGHDYAVRSAAFLEILVIGNAVRMLCYPYTLIVVAIGAQHLATISAIAEAVVNFTLSIILVQRIGAVGVAIGTLVGAFVGVAAHIVVSMKFTRSTILVSRSRFVLEGFGRPLLCTIPSMILVPILWLSRKPTASPALACGWAIATSTIAWLVGLTPQEKAKARALFSRILHSAI